MGLPGRLERFAAANGQKLEGQLRFFQPVAQPLREQPANLPVSLPAHSKRHRPSGATDCARPQPDATAFREQRCVQWKMEEAAGPQHIAEQTAGLTGCPICCTPLAAMDAPAQQHHINSCLDAAPLSQRPVPTQQLASNNSTTRDIRALLEGMGLAKHAVRFEQEELDLISLPFLTGEDLVALGVTCAKERTALSAAAANMAARAAPSEACNQSDGSMNAEAVSRPATQLERIASQGAQHSAAVPLPAFSDSKADSPAGGCKGIRRCSGQPQTSGVGFRRVPGSNLCISRAALSSSTQTEKPEGSGSSLSTGHLRIAAAPPTMGLQSGPSISAANKGAAPGQTCNHLAKRQRISGSRPQVPSSVQAASVRPLQAKKLQCQSSGDLSAAGQQRSRVTGKPCLKPPATDSAPGKPGKMVPVVKDSSYARDLEANLLTALFVNEASQPPAGTQMASGSATFGPSALASSANARLIEKAASLWACSTCKDAFDGSQLVRPFADRVAESKAKRAAATAIRHQQQRQEALLQEGASGSKTVRAQEGALDNSVAIASGSVACTTKGLQLQALKTELQAAEQTVNELKRLIAELEASDAK